MMTHRRLKVMLLFGGMSAEHDVSIESARAVHRHLDAERYEPILIYITRQGRWCEIDHRSLARCGAYEDSHGWQKRISRSRSTRPFLPWLVKKHPPIPCDIVFPLLHGPNGEDGKIQALLELAGIPYVGANSYSSALAMDKYVAKILFRGAGLDTPDAHLLTEPDVTAGETCIEESFGYPVFIKPCSLGSSIGISKVSGSDELAEALDSAFAYDRRVLIEQAIPAREVEISVMGNEKVRVSRPGELIPHREFYDYADKYLDNKTTFQLPASLPDERVRRLRAMAETAFRCLFLNGMARVDFFIHKQTDTIYINEINTIPGFTAISMFPKLWELEQITFSRLLDELINLGFEYHRSRRPRT